MTDLRDFEPKYCNLKCRSSATSPWSFPKLGNIHRGQFQLSSLTLRWAIQGPGVQALEQLDYGLVRRGGGELHPVLDERDCVRRVGPQNADRGEGHVIRGGSWANNELGCRFASRYNQTRLRKDAIGFRLALRKMPSGSER